ncbi:unnamed protein product [Dicrocoelium dendriticum]|nr:unnamed protein product [Dicrocoelium dendriticum]
MVDLESVFIALVCATIYVNSIFCGFVFDDASAVKENKDLRPSTPLSELFRNDFWGTPMHQERSHKSYRPLTVLTFRWNYLVHGLHPAGYHAVNVILHLLVCILFLRVCRILSSECCAFISSLHFAVHPIHTEAVTGVVGRAELLSGLIFLLIFIQNEKSRHERCLHQSISVFIICVLLTIGTLCKEQCITIVAVLWAYEFILIYKSLLQLRIDDDTSATAPMSCLRRLFCRSPMHLLEMFWKYFFKNQRFLHLFVISLWAAVLMFVRMRIMDFQLPHFSEFDNPAAHAPTLIRRLTYLYLIPVNLWLLFCPSGLCVDWTLSSLPLITGWMDPRNCLTLVAFLGLALLFVMALNPNSSREQSVILAMGLSIMVFAFIPASNLFFPVGFVIAERVLYVPSFGFSLLFGFGYHVSVKRSLLNDRRPYSSQLQPVSVIKRKPIRPFVYKAILVLVLLSLSAKTVRRNFDWIDEYRLFSSALKVNPRNAKMWNNVGHALESEQKFHHALEYFRKAVDVQPNDIGAHINVGRTYVTLGKFDEAENAYRRALDFFPKPKRGQTYFARVAPKDLMVFINLANLLLNKDPPQLDEAAGLLRRAISLRSDFVEAYQNYGSVLIKQNKDSARFLTSNNDDQYRG